MNKSYTNFTLGKLKDSNIIGVKKMLQGIFYLHVSTTSVTFL